MAHINSYSKEIDGRHFLFTKGPKGKEIQIGGPYKSSSEATFMSKDASKNVGKGSIADYKQYLKALYYMSHEGRPQISKVSPTPPIPKHKPPKPKTKTSKRKGGNVKGYITGDLINPMGGAVGAGVGKGVAPKKKPQNPLAAKDAALKENALKKKQMDIAAAKPKPPQAPGMPPPRRMGRKGGKVSMRRGDKVYSNVCVSPIHNRKK